jgi:predicted GIY-YIG superfamily endonuclease
MNLNTQKFESNIIKFVLKNRDTPKPFNEIVNGFEQKLKDFDPIKKSFLIKEYFGEGIGKSTSLRMLSEKVMNYNSSSTDEDFRGLYVFLIDNNPFYVGISRGIVKRIHQHVKGKNHNTSSLAFKIAKLQYKFKYNKEFLGTRKELNFESEVEPIKKFLMKQKVAIIPVENDDELVLFEIYCSMQLGTRLNSFQTH